MSYTVYHRLHFFFKYLCTQNYRLFLSLYPRNLLFLLCSPPPSPFPYPLPSTTFNFNIPPPRPQNQQNLNLSRQKASQKNQLFQFFIQYVFPPIPVSLPPFLFLLPTTLPLSLRSAWFAQMQICPYYSCLGNKGWGCRQG